MENAFIYIIKNKINNHFYLGSTIDINKRKSVHFNSLRKNKHHSVYLQRAFNKYKEENFEFLLFQYCYINEKINLEQYYLDLYKPKYNTSLSSKCPMLGRKHSEESIKKFKAIKRPKGNECSWYGKRWSDEDRIKYTKLRLDRKHKHSEATKIKMRDTAIKKERYKDLLNYIEKIKKSVIDSNGNIFKSATECSLFWKISPQTVCDILKGRHSKTRKGISFKYV